jgi:hypothetical protein
MESIETNRRKLSIRDLLIATSLIAALLASSFSISRIFQEPNKFADSLGHQTAGVMMVACTIGLVGFPIMILLAGFVILRKSTSPLRMFYAAVILVTAIGSVPLAYIVGRACAYSIV